MGLFSSFDISASGMTAERLRYDTIAQNLANIDTTRSADGTPYVRKTVMFQEKQNMDFDSLLMTTIGQVGNGVKVTSIVKDTSTAMKKVYDPSHPDADDDGYVLYPNINTITEMTNLIDASRAYEANVTAFNGSKSMVMTALDMGK